MAKINFQYCAKEDITCRHGTEIKREVLAESCGATHGELLGRQRKRTGASGVVRKPPGFLGGQGGVLIILHIARRDVQESRYIAARADESVGGFGHLWNRWIVSIGWGAAGAS